MLREPELFRQKQSLYQLQNEHQIDKGRNLVNSWPFFISVYKYLDIWLKIMIKCVNISP